MRVLCTHGCGASFDDEFRTTICPHQTFAANDGHNHFAHHPESLITYPDNKGHVRLIADLRELLKEAEDYQFDDFKNTIYATPKVELFKKLAARCEKVKQGKYDQ